LRGTQATEPKRIGKKGGGELSKGTLASRSEREVKKDREEENRGLKFPITEQGPDPAGWQCREWGGGKRGGGPFEKKGKGGKPQREEMESNRRMQPNRCFQKQSVVIALGLE